MRSSKKVTMRALSCEDAGSLSRWFRDPEVVKYSLTSLAYPQSDEDIGCWLKAINQQKNNIQFGVCCADSGLLIGYAGICGISQINRSGEFFILIGDRQYWGKGIATQVTKLIVEYGFATLGLYRIGLTAFVENKAAIRAYEKAGFKHEGVMRGAGFRQGKFIDKVLMAVINSD